MVRQEAIQQVRYRDAPAVPRAVHIACAQRCLDAIVEFEEDLAGDDDFHVDGVGGVLLGWSKLNGFPARVGMAERPQNVILQMPELWARGISAGERDCGSDRFELRNEPRVVVVFDRDEDAARGEFRVGFVLADGALIDVNQHDCGAGMHFGHRGAHHIRGRLDAPLFGCRPDDLLGELGVVGANNERPMHDLRPAKGGRAPRLLRELRNRTLGTIQGPLPHEQAVRQRP
jgi:hypothetical protein